jgi:putative methionine-R-sulfoxide reductase with GAF domain
MIMSIDAFLPVSSTSFSRGDVSAGGWYDDSELSLQQLLNEHKITLNRLELLAMTLTAGKDWYGFPVKKPSLASCRLRKVPFQGRPLVVSIPILNSYLRKMHWRGDYHSLST